MATPDYDSIDYFRDSDVLINDPYSYFDHLRSGCPVQRENHHGVVMVTGYEEACAIYSDPDTFSSANSVTGPFPGFPVPLEGDDVSELIEKHRDELPFSDQLPAMDPPKHRDHRGLLMRLMTPARLRENEAAMESLADRQIAEFIDRGSCELIKDFAGPFTMYVIADLLGVPESDWEELRLNVLAERKSGSSVGSSKSDEMHHSPLEYLYGKFSAYVEGRRKEPQEDVLTGLALATFPDGTLPEVIDVVRVATNLFAAGQETTVRMLSAAFQLIAERPEIQQQLREHRNLIPGFVEEILRFESPVKGDFRLTRVPTTVGGVALPAGTTVMVVNGGANRDPAKFENPNEFVLTRENARQHLAFGRGIHTCPGGPLARAEGRVSLERLLDRMANIRINEAEHGPAGDRRYHYAPTYILRGLRALHLEYDPVPH